MVTIMITSGTYGWRPLGSKHPQAVEAGETCMVTTEEAKRLSALGVATIVEETAADEVATPPAPVSGEDAGGDTPTEDEGQDEAVLTVQDGHFLPEDLMELTKKDLLALAADLGLEPSKSANKEALADMIAQVEIPDQEAVDAAEDAPPELSVSEPQ